MKDNKKTWIKLGVLSIMVFTFLGLALVNNYVINKYKNALYVKNLMKEPTQSVYSEIQNTMDDNATIIPPFAGDDVVLTTNYYNKDDDEELQKQSIIHFESTYLPSTGVVYTSEVPFDVIAVYDGEVVSVDNDNILGKNIIIKHNDNLLTSYYSLEGINLVKGDKVVQGQILGTASKNKISNKPCLFFEVTYQNEVMNPNLIFNQRVKNFS